MPDVVRLYSYGIKTDAGRGTNHNIIIFAGDCNVHSFRFSCDVIGEEQIKNHLVFGADIHLFNAGDAAFIAIVVFCFGLPLIPFFGEYLILDRFVAAALAFILNYAAYFAEIFRGGLISIDKGQYEAAQVLGLNKFQTTVRVILPQMTARCFHRSPTNRSRW